MKKAEDSFPLEEIIEVNDLLHQLLGSEVLEVKIEGRAEYFQGERIIIKSREDTLDLIKQGSKEAYLDVYRFLHFYHPRWIAYNVIKDSGEAYAEFSSNNELLLALTAIIDSVKIDNSEGEKRKILKLIGKIFPQNKERVYGYTQHFTDFLNRHLDPEEIKKISHLSIYERKRGRNRQRKIKNVADLGRYLYKLRSLIIHEAELGGIYPYHTSFTIDFNRSKIDNITYMVTPEIFRRLLWKAIFKSRGFEIII